ncbi:MAG: hypothetical protein ACPGJV_12655 [Bacteriovoracaceae bacterium]
MMMTTIFLSAPDVRHYFKDLNVDVLKKQDFFRFRKELGDIVEIQNFGRGDWYFEEAFFQTLKSKVLIISDPRVLEDSYHWLRELLLLNRKGSFYYIRSGKNQRIRVFDIWIPLVFVSFFREFKPIHLEQTGSRELAMANAIEKNSKIAFNCLNFQSLNAERSLLHSTLIISRSLFLMIVLGFAAKLKKLLK